MSKAMQELFQNERNKGRTIEKIEITTAHLRSVMAKLNFDVDQAMDALSIDAKDRDFYRERLASLSKN